MIDVRPLSAATDVAAGGAPVDGPEGEEVQIRVRNEEKDRRTKAPKRPPESAYVRGVGSGRPVRVGPCPTTSMSPAGRESEASAMGALCSFAKERETHFTD